MTIADCVAGMERMHPKRQTVAEFVAGMAWVHPKRLTVAEAVVRFKMLLR